MAIKSFKRYEKKYLLTGEQYEKLIPRLLEYMKMDDHCINEIEYYLSHTKVNPTVYIGYNRIAFFGKEDKDFRLTIDSKIIPRREDLFLESGCHGTDILKPNEYLMKVKILDAIPMWLAEIFSMLPTIISIIILLVGNNVARAFSLAGAKYHIMEYGKS